MPTTTATKSVVTLIASQSVTASTTIRGRIDVRTALGGKINLLVTNNATPPTTAARVNIYVAHDTGTLPAEGSSAWILEQTMDHSLTGSAVLPVPYPFGPDVQHIMVEVVAANQATTVRCEATRFDSAATV